jgi:hypothetical protein
MIRNKKSKKRTKIVHTNCQCVVAPRGPHLGLYCQEHHQWIKWINPWERQVLAKMDVIWLDYTPDWAK